MRRALILLCLLVSAGEVHAQTFDAAKTVIQVHQLKLMRAEFGTAACLDTPCRFLLTNYHVALVAAPKEIHGVPVVQRFTATGPTDEGAMLNLGQSGNFIYNPARDLAIYELARPIGGGYHGVPFSTELTEGDDVSIIGFPGRTFGIQDFKRTLTTWQGSFVGEDQNGCLVFRYVLSGAGKVRPGTSGGIVIHDGKIVGILRGSAQDELIAEAVPVASLEIFLAKTNPYLHVQLFPQRTIISPVSYDVYSAWDTFTPPTDELQRRIPEGADIQALRAKAQALYASMKYLMATQTFSWNAGGSPQAENAYEIKVRDGLEIFSKNNHEYLDIPHPPINGFVVPSALWLNAPRYADEDLSLHIRRADSITVNGALVSVYQWQALGRESKMCQTTVYSLLPFGHDKTYDVNCWGEIWTDASGDIVRISEAYSDAPGPFRGYEAIAVYGRVNLNGESHLVPLTISTHVQWGQTGMLHCDSVLSDYKMWGSQVALRLIQ